MILTYNGKSFEKNESDGYINAGEMCAANSKKLNDWMRTKQSEAYQTAVSSATGIPVTGLVRVSGDEIGGKGSTWVHPLVALAIAQWISPDFHVWCNMNIKILMEQGRVFLSAPNGELAVFGDEIKQAIDQKMEEVARRVTEVVEKATEKIAEKIEYVENEMDIKLDQMNNNQERVRQREELERHMASGKRLSRKYWGKKVDGNG